jgi:hypothetical protein
VSPNVYTTLEEIDMFVMAMEDALKGGVPTELAAARRGPVEGVDWAEII